MALAGLSCSHDSSHQHVSAHVNLQGGVARLQPVRVHVGCGLKASPAMAIASLMGTSQFKQFKRAHLGGSASRRASGGTLHLAPDTLLVQQVQQVQLQSTVPLAEVFLAVRPSCHSSPDL